VIVLIRNRNTRLATEISIGARPVRLCFEPVPGVGVAVHVPDDAPHTPGLRAQLHAYAGMGWEAFEDDVVPDVHTVLTGGVVLPRLGAPPRVNLAALASASAAADAAPTDDYDALVARGDMPSWAAAALRRGWLPEDIGDYAAAESLGRVACGLRILEVATSVPPAGWTRVERVWEVVGWEPPPGFVPPSVPPAVVPDEPPPVEQPDERFAEPTPQTGLGEDEGDHEEDVAPSSPLDVDVAQACAQLVAVGAAEDTEQAARIIELAREVAPGAGAPAPRGKVNIKMRNNKLPNLDEAAYEIIKPLLPIT
jgi:hypothetical protein